MVSSTAQAAPAAATAGPLDAIASEAGAVAAGERMNTWAARLVAATVRRHNARARRRPIAAGTGVTERREAHGIIRRSCVRAAAAGAATAAVATGASVATAQTGGTAGLLAIPAAALSIGAEAALRLLEHVRMSCEIADLFELRFDPDEPADLWALLALSLGPASARRRGGTPAQQLRGLSRTEADVVGRRLGAWLLGEGLLRNAVPFLDVAASSAANWALTRRLGDTMRRYARYRRAFDDALGGDEALAGQLHLLVPGVWFLFIADGPPSSEEAALLASLLRRCDPAFLGRLDEALADEIAWIERLPEVPLPARPAFFYALEVAAAVDKQVSLRERRLLEHAARALGLDADASHVDRMTEELEERGVLELTRAS